MTRHPKRVVLDLARLRLIDGRGVSAVVAFYRGVRAHGGDLTVVGLNNQPLSIFRLMRLDQVLGIH